MIFVCVDSSVTILATVSQTSFVMYVKSVCLKKMNSSKKGSCKLNKYKFVDFFLHANILRVSIKKKWHHYWLFNDNMKIPNEEHFKIFCMQIPFQLSIIAFSIALINWLYFISLKRIKIKLEAMKSNCFKVFSFNG